MGCLPGRPRFLVKSILWKNPLLRFFLRFGGVIPVYRHQANIELIPKKDVEVFFKRYLEEMERLAVAADEL